MTKDFRLVTVGPILYVQRLTNNNFGRREWINVFTPNDQKHALRWIEDILKEEQEREEANRVVIVMDYDEIRKALHENVQQREPS